MSLCFFVKSTTALSSFRVVSPSSPSSSSSSAAAAAAAAAQICKPHQGDVFG